MANAGGRTGKWKTFGHEGCARVSFGNRASSVCLILELDLCAGKIVPRQLLNVNQRISRHIAAALRAVAHAIVHSSMSHIDIHARDLLAETGTARYEI
jgi:hypothetical protein